jgi:hypothetical protein
MKEALVIALALPFFAALHRFRGGGLFAWKAPIHRRFIATLLLGIVTGAIFKWQLAVFIALQYLLLVLPSWGRWYMIGYGNRDWSGEADTIEAFLERITYKLGRTGSDYTCFVLRNIACMLPTFVAAYWFVNWQLALLAIILSIAIVECYRLCWRFYPAAAIPTTYAEWYSGAMIGACTMLGIALL